MLKAFLEVLKIKFEIQIVNPDDSPYNSDFVAMIERSKKDYKAGKGIKVDLDDIWK